MPPRLGNVNPAGVSWTPAARALWAQLSGLQPLLRAVTFFSNRVTFLLLVPATGVMNVITAQEAV